ncbi:hypothetical protein [Megasphaera stantonii]|uniref:hypothetical protein n=1 Tax=Megasphaera stantonii TaxID=2144175 RepID=UPI00195DF7D5|nr:hypothetical protein [Megasphaera stantonii]MBM6732904.1 hypothetical protein [Megasphaera stantonii]
MTTIELMNNVREYLEVVLADYSTTQKAGVRPVAVYAGYPPLRLQAAEKESYVYVLALEWVDKADQTFSQAKIEIGFSIYDDDTEHGVLSLYNLMEHVRQALLKKRTLNGRNRLELPLKGELCDVQTFPQWQGRIEAMYTIGQPIEEEMEW